MSGARLADGLLSAQLTLELIDLAAQYPRDEERLLQDFSAIHPPIWAKGRNTITLLDGWGMLRRSGRRVTVSSEAMEPGGRASLIAHAVCHTLASTVINGASTPCVRLLADRDGLWLDALLLPYNNGLSLWITEFRVAERSSVRDRFWRVIPPHDEKIVRALRTANESIAVGSLRPEQLQANLQRRSEAGEEAEQWVLDFERRRLRGHPLVDQVRRVSEETVSAGFDIASFSTKHSLRHDFFLEVKSFAGQKRFFWSTGEIEAARRLGEAYCLYLVDRDLMDSPEYEPQVIRGPYAALFEVAAAGWEVSTATYECVYKPRLD
jgi:hypothetical protein